MSAPCKLDLGEGLAVRQMTVGDATAMARHGNDLDIARQMRDTFPSPYSEKDALSFIERILDQSKWKRVSHAMIDPDKPTQTSDREPLIPTAYVITLHNQTIGGIGLVFRADTERRTTELGYW